MRLALVVDDDPASCCSFAVGHLHELDAQVPFTVGRVGQHGLVIRDGRVSKLHFTIEFMAGEFWLSPSLASSGGLYVQGRPARRMPLTPGLLLFMANVVLRVVALDGLSALSPCGPWVRLGTSSTSTPCGPAFSIAGGALRRGWLTSSTSSRMFDEIASLAAVTDGVLPRRIETFATDNVVHSVFDVGDFIDFDRFVARAAPLSPAVGLAIGVRLAHVIARVRDATGGDLVVAGGVTFDGRVVIAPPRPPLRAVPPGSGVDVRRLVALLHAMKLDDPGLRLHLEAWAIAPPSFAVLDEWLRRHARDAVGSDEEFAAVVAGIVSGLFRDDVSAAELVDEQLQVLTPEALSRMLP